MIGQARTKDADSRRPEAVTNLCPSANTSQSLLSHGVRIRYFTPMLPHNLPWHLNLILY